MTRSIGDDVKKWKEGNEQKDVVSLGSRLENQRD